MGKPAFILTAYGVEGSAECFATFQMGAAVDVHMEKGLEGFEVRVQHDLGGATLKVDLIITQKPL